MLKLDNYTNNKDMILVKLRFNEPIIIHVVTTRIFCAFFVSLISLKKVDSKRCGKILSGERTRHTFIFSIKVFSVTQNVHYADFFPPTKDEYLTYNRISQSKV